MTITKTRRSDCWNIYGDNIYNETDAEGETGANLLIAGGVSEHGFSCYLKRV